LVKVLPSTFQYLFKFADSYANTVHDALVAHFVSYQGELSQISDLIDSQSAGKQIIIQTLDELQTESMQIADRINSLRDQLMQPDR